MTTLKAPTQDGEVSVGGIVHKIDNWLVDVTEELVAPLLESHGFVISEPDNDPSYVPEVDIDTMSRIELFAYLKAKGIAAKPPITNDDLRRLAKGETVTATDANAAPAGATSAEEADTGTAATAAGATDGAATDTVPAGAADDSAGTADNDPAAAAAASTEPAALADAAEPAQGETQ